jgi:hypothetical protein
MILTAVQVGISSYTIHTHHGYLLFLALYSVQACLAMIPTKFIGRFNTFIYIAAIFVFIIVSGRLPPFHPIEDQSLERSGTLGSGSAPLKDICLVLLLLPSWVSIDTAFM